MPKRLTEQAASEYILELFRGITYKRTFQYTNQDGSPVDLSLMSVNLGIKGVFDSTLILSSAGSPSTLGSSVTVTDAVNGKFTVLITDEETDTAELTDCGKWWLELHSMGDVTLLWRDRVEVKDI